MRYPRCATVRAWTGRRLAFALCCAGLCLAGVGFGAESPAPQVREWLSALTAGDPEPLHSALMLGRLPERVARRYHPDLRIRETDPAGFRAGLSQGLAAALTAWAETYREGRPAIISEIVAATESVITARLESEKERQYFRFLFEREGQAWVLADVQAPLLGTDLESLLVDAVTNRPAPKARKAAVDLLVWVGRTLCVAGALAALWMLARRRRSARATAAALAGLVLALAVWGALARVTPRVSQAEEDIWLRRERITLITSLLALQRAAEAEARAREFLLRWPDHPRGQLLLAHALFRQGKNKDAGRLYREMLARDRYPELAHNQLARIAEAGDDPAGAAEHLSAVIEKIGPDEALLVELAHNQLWAGAVPSASRTLTLVLEGMPEHRLAREMRARAALRSADPAAAAADLRTLRRQDPQLEGKTLREDPEFASLAEDARFADLFE